MKIAISGKGGAGKTTFTALLGYLYSREKKVFLIDADPDGNLCNALGIGAQEASKVTPVMDLKEIIEARTGSRGSGMYQLNPRVDDIPEKYSIRKGNISYLVLGNIDRGGSGCFCPENAFLKSLLGHLLVGREEAVLLDMPAGIEHLGRGTAKAVDILVIVTEPTAKSVQTTQRVLKLAADLGIKKCLIVGNKIRQKQDEEYISSQFDNKLILGYTKYSESVMDADRKNTAVFEASQETLAEVEAIKQRIDTLGSP